MGNYGERLGRGWAGLVGPMASWATAQQGRGLSFLLFLFLVFFSFLFFYSILSLFPVVLVFVKIYTWHLI